MAVVLLGLDKLKNETVFVDFFKISYYTHSQYSWSKKGTHRTASGRLSEVLQLYLRGF
jgi:hypothetical protein